MEEEKEEKMTKNRKRIDWRRTERMGRERGRGNWRKKERENENSTENKNDTKKLKRNGMKHKGREWKGKGTRRRNVGGDTKK